MENNQMEKKVKDIIFNDETRSGYNLNRILFEGGYIAQEKAPLERQSNFTAGKVALFRITHPAKGDGKYDWVLFVANISANPIPGGQPVFSGVNPEAKSMMMREYILISQNALNNAVAAAPFVYGKTEGVEDMDDFIMELAKDFSAFIVQNAKNLYDASMQLPTGEKGETETSSAKKDTVQDS